MFKGCFGKAEFSRGFPSLNTNNFEKDEHESDLTHSMKNIQLMSNERYSVSFFRSFFNSYLFDFRFNRRKEWSNFDSKELSADDNFHDKFLKEFLEDKTRLLNLNEFDLKPKCRVEIDKKLILFNEDNVEEDCVKEKIKNDKKPKILAPNFDPFAFYVKDIPNRIVEENSYLMYEEVRLFY